MYFKDGEKCLYKNLICYFLKLLKIDEKIVYNQSMFIANKRVLMGQDQYINGEIKLFYFNKFLNFIFLGKS
jgi:hypothetical protein